MDQSTLERLAEMICGDDREREPTYRTGTDLSRFFERAGVPRFQHDGSTRKWWTLSTLREASGSELALILRRLASPREYGGDPLLVKKAVLRLNEILRIERLRMVLDGVEPKIARLTQSMIFDTTPQQELKPLAPPDFSSLGLENGLGELLARRWEETQRCVDCRAFLAALVMMGSLLEGMLLGTMQRFPRTPNSAATAPRDKMDAVKAFNEWRLSEMIDVAHSIGWLGLDVKKFSHALRDFRNLVHPHQQLTTAAHPDEDTCKISWLVVQAATNDLAKVLHSAR